MTRAEAVAKLVAAAADLAKYPAGTYIALQAEWAAIEALETLGGGYYGDAREVVSHELLTEHDYSTHEGSFVDDNGYAIGFPMRTMQFDGSYTVRDAGL